MYRFLATVLILLFTLPAHAAVKVMATIPDLAAIAREVGKDKITVSSMTLPTQDPHFVDARPSLALELSQADLLLVAGLDLEIGWLPVLLTGARNTRIQTGAMGYLDCSQFVAVLDVPSQAVDRSMGDVHPGGNPHYLLDPRQGVAVAFGIAARLGQIDPANQNVYLENASTFSQAINAARLGWEQKLAPIRGKEVVTYHKSLTYLADWLGFTVPITVEPKPGIPPTPAHVVTVMQAVQSKGVKIILQEGYYPETTAGLIASKTGVKLVRLEGGTSGSDSYLQHIDKMVNTIAGVL